MGLRVWGVRRCDMKDYIYIYIYVRVRGYFGERKTLKMRESESEWGGSLWK